MADSRQLMNRASGSFEPQPQLSPMFQKRPFATEPEEELDDQEVTPIQTRSETLVASPFDMADMSLYSSGTPAYPVQAKSEEDTEFDDEPEDFTLQRRAFTSLLQCQENDIEDEEESEISNVQAKLTIGQPGDRYEQEADNVAAQVMKMPEPQQIDEEDSSVQRRSPISPLVQRREDNESDSDSDDQLAQMKPNIQAKSNKPSAPTNFESRLAQKKGGGSPLPQETKGFMESRFGADFSGVRIHESPKEASEIRAQAFTHGQDIYFNSGKYNPGSSSGKELLAHELTHTIQQTEPQLHAKSISSSSIDVQRLCSKCEKEKNVQVKEDFGFSKHVAKLQSKGNFDPGKVAESSVTPKQLQDESLNVSNNQLKNSNSTKDIADSEALEAKFLDLKSAKASFSNKDIVGSDVQEAVENLEADTEKSLEVGSQQETTEGETKPVAKEEESGNTVDQEAQRIQAEMAAKLQATPDVFPELATETEETSAPESTTSTSQETTSNGATGLDATSAGETPASGDEAAEAESMRQQLQSAEPSISGKTGDQLLSPTQQNIARTSLQNAPASPASGSDGGVGGTAIPEKPTPSVPDVSQSEPSAAIASIGNLPPVQLQSALGSVAGAVNNTVSKERTNFATNPPQAETLDGREGAASAKEISPGKTPLPVEKKPEGIEVPTQKPAPTPIPAAAPLPPVATPAVKDTEDGTLSEGDAQKIQSSIGQLPTHDSGAPSTSVGEAPVLVLEGNADPQKTAEQKAELDSSLAETQVQGQQEAQKPMGEQEVYATVPKATLQATIGQGGSGMASASGAMAEATEGLDAVSVVAQEEQGAEIQAAVAKAQGDMSAQKGEHDATIAEEQVQSNAEIDLLKQDNIQQQNAERTRVQAEVGQFRSEWQAEQEAEIASAKTEADLEISQGLSEVETEQSNAESNATQEIKKGEEDAEAERIKGEEEAEKERKKGDEKSDGIFGWAANAAKSFFEGIKNAIKTAFDKARQAIRTVIEKAKELATEAIEAGRKAIVGIISRVGDALIAIGDVLLAKFPELQEKYKGFIQDAVKVAEDTVNTLAEGLKTGIQAALDLLGKGLEAALSLYEKGLMMAVDGVSSVVNSAIEMAQSAIQAMGAFAAIAPDIAANPSQWISNLGGSVEGGIQGPTLWEAFKGKTKEWFGGKVQEVTSLTPEQVDDLDEGGFGLGEIAKMVWENIVGAIPGILIGILLEKLVSMLVPAVGAVLTVLQSLQAAWGTVSQILTAFTLFVSFLQAIKTGSAAPLFAGLLAAAGIVLLDFVAQWMMRKLIQAAKAIAGRLKGTANEVKDKRKVNEDSEEESLEEESLKDSENTKQKRDKDEEDLVEGSESSRKKSNQEDDEEELSKNSNRSQQKLNDEEESLEDSDDTQQKRNSEDVERDKAAEEDLPGGHKVKVTEDGDVYACSKCEVPDLPDDEQRKVDAATTPEEKAKLTQDALGKKERQSGKELAAARGLPEHPEKEGYEWYSDQDGKLKVRNTPGNNGPVLDYAEDSGIFTKKPNTTPKPDIRTVEGKKEKIQHSDIDDSYKEQLKNFESQRTAHQDRKRKAKDSGDDAKASEAHGKMVEASEQLGEIATDAAVNSQKPNAKRLKSDLPGKQKTGEFDRIYQDDDGVHIYESKGAGAQRGSRQIKGGKRAEQGTPEYMQDVIANMESKVFQHKNSDRYMADPDFRAKVDDLQKTTRAIRKAERDGKLRYFQVNQKVNSSGSLKPHIEITKFADISDN